MPTIEQGGSKYFRRFRLRGHLDKSKASMMGWHKSSTKTPFTPRRRNDLPSYFSTAEKSEISKPPSVERKLMAASLSEASQSRRSLRQSFWPITGQRIDTSTSAAVYPGGETPPPPLLLFPPLSSSSPPPPPLPSSSSPSPSPPSPPPSLLSPSPSPPRLSSQSADLFYSFAGEICDRHNLHPLGALVWKRCKIHDLELEGIELALRKRKSGRRRDWGSLESQGSLRVA